MSRGHQRIIVTGYLGADPVTKAPPRGGTVTEMRLAVTEVYRGKGEELQEHTEWLRIKLFGRDADTAGKYLAKGRMCTIEGKLHTEKWQASDGSDRYTTWIYATPGSLVLYGGSLDGQETGRAHQGRPQPQPEAATEHAGTGGGFDDDIDF